MKRKVALGLAAVIALFLVYVGIQPKEYLVSREVTIRASAETIFPHISNARLMNDWNPWSEFDPTAKMTFSGPEAGVGSRTSWVDGEKLGTGSATVTESVTNQIVKTKLEYVKPMSLARTMSWRRCSSGGSVRLVNCDLPMRFSISITRSRGRGCDWR